MNSQRLIAVLHVVAASPDKLLTPRAAKHQSLETTLLYVRLKRATCLKTATFWRRSK